MVTTGIVVSYFENRVYGFVRYETDKDIFFRRADCAGPVPQVGQRVEFTIIEDTLGRPKAINVRPLAGATASWLDDPRRTAKCPYVPANVGRVLADERESQADFGIVDSVR